MKDIIYGTLLSLALVVALSGCSGYSVTPERMNKAVGLCANNGGLYQIYVNGVTTTVHCNNKAEFIFDDKSGRVL